MKRSYFIAIATTLALVLIAVWVYILFFSNTSQQEESFAELNLNDTTDSTIPANTPEPEPVVDVVNIEKLRQLTTKPVVGFTEIVDESGEVDSIYYTEAGTGHVYSINLTSGKEERISGTTFANIKKSDITPNGQYILIETGLGNNREFVLGEFSTSTNEYIFNTVADDIYNFTATKDNNFLFTAKLGSKLQATHYYPISETAEIIFEIPFVEAAVRWGDLAIDTHYVYPKASARLEGYLYQARDNKLKRLPVAGRGLSAIGNQESVLYSTQVDRDYLTRIYDLETKETVDLEVIFGAIIDKCVNYPAKKTFICGTSNEPQDQNTPDDWYKGETTYSDSLWEVDASSLSFKKLVDVPEESGRNIDSINLEIGASQQSVFFQNKSDMTLWMLTLPPISSSLNNDTSSGSEEVINDDFD
jgi:hypothetical protein